MPEKHNSLLDAADELGLNFEATPTKIGHPKCPKWLQTKSPTLLLIVVLSALANLFLATDNLIIRRKAASWDSATSP